MIREKILTNSGYMRSGVIMLKKLRDAAAQMEMQPAGGFYPYILRRL
jgi:hypothetical protein